MPRRKDESKMGQIQKMEKACQLAEKYKLKSIEVSENSFKIEFSDNFSSKKAENLTKAQKDAIIADKDRQIMEEMQITDPETYEELIVLKNGGLRELNG